MILLFFIALFFGIGVWVGRRTKGWFAPKRRFTAKKRYALPVLLPSAQERFTDYHSHVRHSTFYLNMWAYLFSLGHTPQEVHEALEALRHDERLFTEFWRQNEETLLTRYDDLVERCAGMLCAGYRVRKMEYEFVEPMRMVLSAPHQASPLLGHDIFGTGMNALMETANAMGALLTKDAACRSFFRENFSPIMFRYFDIQLAAGKLKPMPPPPPPPPPPFAVLPQAPAHRADWLPAFAEDLYAMRLRLLAPLDGQPSLPAGPYGLLIAAVIREGRLSNENYRDEEHFIESALAVLAQEDAFQDYLSYDALLRSQAVMEKVGLFLRDALPWKSYILDQELEPDEDDPLFIALEFESHHGEWEERYRRAQKEAYEKYRGAAFADLNRRVDALLEELHASPRPTPEGWGQVWDAHWERFQEIDFGG